MRLVPQVETLGDPRFDVSYQISEGAAAFCDGGTSRITKKNVTALQLAQDVRFCRRPKMAVGYDSITVLVTISEQGGQDQSRDTVIIVKPLDLGSLELMKSREILAEPSVASHDIQLGLPSSTQQIDIHVRFSLAQDSDVWFERDGEITKTFELKTSLGPNPVDLSVGISLARGDGVVRDGDAIVTASLHLASGGYLGQRRCAVPVPNA